MENIKKLYIEAHKEDIEPKNIRFENLGYFFDIKSGIGVQKKYIESDLKVGFVYDFIYEDYNDADTYCFVILKREGNIYYIAEYYNGFYQYKETLLDDCWVKCDVKKELGIDIEEWRTKKIYNKIPDMREKVKEYIFELDVEIERCVDEAESILAAIGDYDENPMPTNYIRLEERTKVLGEVKNDLQGRLDELI